MIFSPFTPIPFEYRVILPKYNQTVFDAPSRNFIYTEDDEDLSFLPKDPSSGFGTGSPSVSVNTEPLKANEEPVIQPVEVTTDCRKSPKPKLFVVYPGKTLAPGSSTTRATRAKTSSSKDDALFLRVSDDDEDATACYLKISAITPPAWKSHLDNHMDVELLDLHNRCYARQAVVDNDVYRGLVSYYRLVSSSTLYGRCRAYEQVADMKEPFDLSKRATPSSAPVSNLMSPPVDVSVAKPQ
uniref:Uncharacterized protein n=1 Tax=Tanacetum cinerariifolium TaxID=118510 RepID=A0A6L2JLE7_TANCI|nr:hypothetical protein [Tanacetum cinerariifolium]